MQITLDNLLLLIHILLLVYWLGADLAVFYATRFVTRPELSTESRALVTRIVRALDLAPRLSMVLILPTGISLSALGGHLSISALAMTLVWLFGLAWAGIVLAGYLGGDRKSGRALNRLDLYLRGVVIVLVGGTGVASLTGTGPWLSEWVAAKAVIYSGLVLCSLLIRLVLRAYAPAFRLVVERGSRRELERLIDRAVGRSRPLVLLVWVGLLAAAWLGLAQPGG